MYRQLAQEKLERMQREHEKEQLANCPFKPKISAISEQIAQSSRMREQILN